MSCSSADAGPEVTRLCWSSDSEWPRALLQAWKALGGFRASPALSRCWVLRDLSALFRCRWPRSAPRADRPPMRRSAAPSALILLVTTLVARFQPACPTHRSWPPCCPVIEGWCHARRASLPRRCLLAASLCHGSGGDTHPDRPAQLNLLAAEVAANSATAASICSHSRDRQLASGWRQPHHGAALRTAVPAGRGRQ